MKEKPILFSTPMVKAILEGKKTQTRRVIKPQPLITKRGTCESDSPWNLLIQQNGRDYFDWQTFIKYVSPYQVGQRLWVRETHYKFGNWVKCGGQWTFFESNTIPVRFFDTAPHDNEILKGISGKVGWYKRPSIFMERHFSRITLEVTEVRVQRLQDISEADIRAEGFYPHPGWEEQMFDVYWNKLNSKRGYSWDSNPFVWAISFKVVK